METPALISAIVQDVQRAQIGSKAEKEAEPDYREVENIAIPQLQTGNKQNEDEGDHSDGKVRDPEGVENQGLEANNPSVEHGMDLDKVEDFNSGNLPQMRPAEVAAVQSDFRKEGTPPTVPVSKESPSPGAPVPVTPIPIVRELVSPDSIPIRLDFEASPEVPEEDQEDRFVSPWSPGVVEDQPVVYMPPPVVETENDEELEELANVGRTERQVPMGSSHHLSAMFDHHHHHDDLKKLVRDLPLDSEPVRHSGDDKKSHDDVSSHRLDHKSGEESPEMPPQRPPNLFRVPSVLEQMVDELLVGGEEGGRGPLYRVPSVLEQMMDDDPIVEREDEPPLTPPEADEYHLVSAEFASDKQEGSRSSHSHHALHVPGSHAMAVTTCRDVHLRDSEAGCMLGDTEVAPAAEGISSFSEASVCEDGDSPEDENCDFPLDEEMYADNEAPTTKDDQEINESKLDSREANGDQGNEGACKEERISKMSSLEEKESESDKLKVSTAPYAVDARRDSKAQFYIGDHHEELHSENSEPSSHREPKEDNNFYSEGPTGNLDENTNKVEENLDAVKEELAEENPAIGTVPYLSAAEPKIPSLNELFNNAGDEGGFEPDPAEETYDDYWALDTPDEPPHRSEFGNLDADEAESHHRDEVLRPKPPPGRSERGCISARWVVKRFVYKTCFFTRC